MRRAVLHSRYRLCHSPLAPPSELHGGNRLAAARRLGCRPEQLLDASASLVPFGPPARLRRRLARLLAEGSALRDYPDRAYWDLRQAIATHHGLDVAAVLPGNGAAELFTWAARDAAAAGTSLLPTPGFADYRRALACWGGRWQALPLPLDWTSAGPGPLPGLSSDGSTLSPDGPSLPPGPEDPPALSLPEPAGGLTVPPGSQVLWITNPHNPSGQLWSRQALEPLLQRFALVIVDEAFLPLVPGGDAQSLVPLLAAHPQLVVIRSLTKLLAIAGLRLGYALGDPARLARWSGWRDPWPVNGLAAAAGDALLSDRRWLQRVHDWVAREGPWLQVRLAAIPGLDPRPTAVNYLLLRGHRDGQPLELEPLRLALEQRHRILLRDCRSFEGLDGTWLRLALQDRAGNRRLLAALGREWPVLMGGG